MHIYIYLYIYIWCKCAYSKVKRQETATPCMILNAQGTFKAKVQEFVQMRPGKNGNGVLQFLSSAWQAKAIETVTCAGIYAGKNGLANTYICWNYSQPFLNHKQKVVRTTFAPALHLHIRPPHVWAETSNHRAMPLNRSKSRQCPRLCLAAKKHQSCLVTYLAFCWSILIKPRYPSTSPWDDSCVAWCGSEMAIFGHLWPYDYLYPNTRNWIIFIYLFSYVLFWDLTASPISRSWTGQSPAFALAHSWKLCASQHLKAKKHLLTSKKYDRGIQPPTPLPSGCVAVHHAALCESCFSLSSATLWKLIHAAQC